MCKASPTQMGQRALVAHRRLPGTRPSHCPLPTAPADLLTKGMGVHKRGRVASPQAFLGQPHCLLRSVGT